MLELETLRVELFEKYAHAFEGAQRLERVLGTSMVALGIEEKLRDQAKSMGGRLYTIQKHLTPGRPSDWQDPLYSKLKQIVDERNRLAHVFFVDNRSRLDTAEGLRAEIAALADFKERCLNFAELFIRLQADAVLLLGQRRPAPSGHYERITELTAALGLPDPVRRLKPSRKG